MSYAVIDVSTLPDVLAVVSSAGSVVGGGVGLVVDSVTLRQTFENLALGAAVGGVCGCFVAFLAYVVIRMLG
jgi:hypothetical protein